MSLETKNKSEIKTEENNDINFKFNNVRKTFSLSLKYILDTKAKIKNILKDYLNYIIHYKASLVTSEFLKFTEFIMHLNEPSVDYVIHYTVLKMHQLLNA